MGEHRSWSDIVEQDEYEADKERFRQWVAEHPNPIDSLRAELAQALSHIESLEQYIVDKGLCRHSGETIRECKRIDICDCFLPEPKDETNG